MFCEKCGGKLDKEGLCSKCDVFNTTQDFNINDVSSENGKIKVWPWVTITIGAFFIMTFSYMTFFKIVGCIGIMILIITNIVRNNNYNSLLELYKMKREEMLQDIKNKGYNISLSALTLDSKGIVIDMSKKEVLVKEKSDVNWSIFNVNDIGGVKIFENDEEEVSKPSSLGVYAAGEVWGTNAAIAKASQPATVTQYCNKLTVVIVTKLNKTLSTIELITNGRIETSSQWYKDLKGLAQEIKLSIEALVSVNEEEVKKIEDENKYKELTDNLISGLDTQKNNNLTLAEELEKYKKLLDDGAITKKEYDKIKKDILNI